MNSFWKRQIPDPIRGLTLERLTTQIDAFNNGYLAEFALTADAMENRDDILKNVITKRKKALTRHGWEILTEDCSSQARAQRDALDFFYRNLTSTHALRPDERGGFQLLVYQMMDAIGKGYAVHEIIWKPVISSNSDGRGPRAPLLTAAFRFVPLWYFEATAGPLRFLRAPGALQGETMRERDWLVTIGDGLMLACSRAFLFKHYPLQAWLDFSEKFALPGVRGITSAARGTPEFAEMEEALASFMKQLSVVTNSAESIDVIDLKGSGQPPFSELVERMDRVMASLWRGADLSTLSRDRGYGATLQEQEALVLEQDDSRLLSEHLNATVDRWIIDMLFGSDVPSLARVKILVTPQESTPQDLAIDQFLLAHGARLPLAQTLERYGRVQAKPDEPALARYGPTTSASPISAFSEDAVQQYEHSSRSNTAPELETAHSKATSPSSPGAPRLCGEIRHSLLPRIFNSKLTMKTELHNSIEPASPQAPLSSASQQELNGKDLNIEAGDAPPPPAVHVSNSTSENRHSPLDIVHLSPIGVFPHSRGFQNVDRTALETMVKNFKSFFGRLGRRFAGIPFYIGHPDVPGYENLYNDRKAYGWIMDLEVREDGLYGRAQWSAAGRDLIAHRHFKFLSPFWEAIRIGTKDGRGVFSPTVLKSVGLTNEPNLPLLPLANSDRDSTADERACLGASLSLFEKTISESTSSATPASAFSEDAAPQNEHYEHSSPPNTTPGLQTENSKAAPSSLCSPSLCADSVPSSAFENRSSDLHHSSLEHRLSILNNRLIQVLLDNAVAQARILPIERPHWQRALEHSFEQTAAALANTAPKLNLSSRTESLPRIHTPGGAETKQKHILHLVNERMRATGHSYHQAWLDLRADHPNLFQ